MRVFTLLGYETLCPAVQPERRLAKFISKYAEPGVNIEELLPEEELDTLCAWATPSITRDASAVANARESLDVWFIFQSR